MTKYIQNEQHYKEVLSKGGVWKFRRKLRQDLQVNFEWINKMLRNRYTILPPVA